MCCCTCHATVLGCKLRDERGNDSHVQSMESETQGIIVGWQWQTIGQECLDKNDSMSASSEDDIPQICKTGQLHSSTHI